MRDIVSRILERCKRWLNSGLILNADASAQVRISKINTSCTGSITVGKNSMLIIEDGVSFRGKLFIGDNCTVHIHKDCSFSHTYLHIINGSSFTASAHCKFNAPELHPATIILDKGKLFLDEHAHVTAELLVRFGGELKIGAYTSVNYNSEIRCEEKIEIGSYCLISYDVCIYDTNAHSTDWKKRREVILRDAVEIEKPSTKPIFIGDDCWIGKGATIVKGVHLGAKTIVGIRTVVPAGDYPESSKIVSAKPSVL